VVTLEREAIGFANEEGSIYQLKLFAKTCKELHHSVRADAKIPAIAAKTDDELWHTALRLISASTDKCTALVHEDREIVASSASEFRRGMIALGKVQGFLSLKGLLPPPLTTTSSSMLN
jgi:hypothetical protein